MKNFKKFLTNVPIEKFLEEVEINDFLWKEYRFRSEYKGSVHCDTDCIVLRAQEVIGTPSEKDVVECINFPNMQYFPVIEDYLEDIKELFNVKEFGRVFLVKLYPGGMVKPHIDQGRYAEAGHRIHLVLQSDEGNTFTCGSETVHMKPGELWWFDHEVVHYVNNNSNRDRIHLLIDFTLKE